VTPNYRFVWNKDEGVCYVSCSTTGYDAQLNSAAGELLARFASADLSLEQLRDQHPNFAGRCLEYGWVGSDSALNGVFAITENLPHLKRLQIELTTHCNLRCGYCYSESGPTKTARLTDAQIFNMLDDASDLGCMAIDFTGGEFFLYSHWREVLNYAKRLGFAVTIHSNGTALTERNVQYLQQTGIRLLQLSFDSHIAEVHDQVRGLPGSFEKALRGADLANEANLPLKLNLMVHSINYRHLREMITWFSTRLRASISLDRIVAVGGERTHRLGITEMTYFEAIAPHLKRQIANSKICESPTAQGFEPDCGVAQSFVYVTADGEFALCPTMTSRESSIFNGPNIRQCSLKQAWVHSAYFTAYRMTNCRNVTTCSAGSKCRGGCRSNAYTRSGFVDSPDVIACNIHKNSTTRYVDFERRYADGDYTAVLR
jgi:radical SAM protein with 4Fe4S-binding SPASM domain